MYRLRAIIDNLKTRKVNNDIEVKDNKVFVETKNMSLETGILKLIMFGIICKVEYQITN